MSKQVQFRGGTSAEHATFTGAAREITVDTTNSTVRVHDGVTAGGSQLAKAGTNTDITSVTLNQTGLNVKGGSSNALIIKPNETLSAARTLNVKVNNADRTVDLSGNLTVSSATTLSGTNTGDQTITLTGDVTGTGTGSFAATIANNAVSLAKMATVATARFLGRTTAGTGDVEAMTGAQATALLSDVVGDSGSGGTKGLVPAPASGDAAASKYLKADGTWAAVSATGMVQAYYSATVTPTAGSPNVSAVDTVNELATITTHGLSSGQQIIAVTNAIGGLTNNRAYYVNVANANQVSFHLTYEDGLAGTSKINLTSNTAMTWRRFVFSGASSSNMSSVQPVAFEAGTSDISLLFHLTNNTLLASSVGIAQFRANNIVDATPTASFVVASKIPTSKSGYTVKWATADVKLTYSGVAVGTISGQSTTAFTIEFWLL